MSFVGSSGSEFQSVRVPHLRCSPHMGCWSGRLLFPILLGELGDGPSNWTLPPPSALNVFASMYHYKFEIVS